MSGEFRWEHLHPTCGVRWRGDWSAGTVEPNRRTFDYELVFFSAGRCRVITGDRCRTVEPGSVMVLPPALIHCTVADTRVTRWCVHFDWLGDCPLHDAGTRPYVFSGENRPFPRERTATEPPGMPLRFPFFRSLTALEVPEFRRRLERVFEEPETPAAGLFRNGALALALAMLPGGAPISGAIASEPPWRHSRVLFRAKERLDAAVTDPALRIECVAAEVGVTPNHLAKVFRRELGVSPRGYLLNRRLALAESLLAAGGTTVREAAFRSGFDDPNYFSRLFRRKRGRAPSEF